jgi:hypothetical protein
MTASERRLFALCALLPAFGFVSAQAWCFGGLNENTSTAPTSSAPASSSWNLRDTSLDVLTGAAIFKNQVGIALAIRGPLICDLSWEVGGILPHPVSGYASDSATSVAPPFIATDNARVRSFGETHVVALYPLFQTPRSPGRPGVTVDAGAGISIGFIQNEIDEQLTGGGSPQFFADTDNKVRLSPRLQLGVAFAFTDRLSIRLDAEWVDYANNDSAGVTNFNLGFRGIIISPVLQVRF